MLATKAARGAVVAAAWTHGILHATRQWLRTYLPRAHPTRAGRISVREFSQTSTKSQTTWVLGGVVKSNAPDACVRPSCSNQVMRSIQTMHCCGFAVVQTCSVRRRDPLHRCEVNQTNQGMVHRAAPCRCRCRCRRCVQRTHVLCAEVRPAACARVDVGGAARRQGRPLQRANATHLCTRQQQRWRGSLG